MTDSSAAVPQSKSGSGSPVLEAVDLYRFHETDGQQQPVVRGVSFALQPSTFTTIMGPSGSGKSTLLHLLAGLDVPSSGTVRLAGEEFSTDDEEQRTRMRRDRIGFIFQFFNLLPDLTVQENIELPLLIAGRRPGSSRARVAQLMELLGIAALARRQPMGLSGGEMQRVSIARALVTEPALVLADEPTGNLSSKAGEEIVQLLRTTRGELDATILLVTHNPRDAAAGDRVLFLNDGVMDPQQALTGGGFRSVDVHRRLEELGI